MRSTDRRGRWRLHACRCIALVAALLNAAAPAFAYAIGQPLHELAGGRPGGPMHVLHLVSPMRAGDAHHAHHHHAGHHDADADCPECPEHAHHDAPAAPHCPYCLDFAAGAPLAPTLPHLAPPPQVPLAVATPPTLHLDGRPSLQLPHPRAPPPLA